MSCISSSSSKRNGIHSGGDDGFVGDDDHPHHQDEYHGTDDMVLPPVLSHGRLQHLMLLRECRYNARSNSGWHCFFPLTSLLIFLPTTIGLLVSHTMNPKLSCPHSGAGGHQPQREARKGPPRVQDEVLHVS